MDFKSLLKSLVVAAGLLAPAWASAGEGDAKAYFRISDDGRSIVNTKNNQSFGITANIAPMRIAGKANAGAWRTDGYTTKVNAQVGDIIDGNSMTASLLFAIDTNPIVGHDDNGANNRYIYVANCLNDGQKSGFAFQINRIGKYRAQVYVGGQMLTLDAGSDRLELWQWENLQIVVDGTSAKLMRNGQQKAAASASSAGVKVKSATLTLGYEDNVGQYCGTPTGYLNGAIDCLEISDKTNVSVAGAGTYADLNLPADRYKNDKLRARFHGQPGMNWTNETHGLLYNAKDGKYHVYFQRTGSAPVMSHAHWGHITSTDLYNWSDDKPAIWPTESYDIRGCWSGCIFTDPVVGGGKPTIIYTGVGYGNGESHSAMAVCTDDTNLRSWTKSVTPANPIDNYNNTARDTYFFRNGNDAYFFIGDEGCLKQYKWNGSGWSDHGNFYTFQDGESGFTEMPNVQQFGNGKWIMTFTPWSADGVVCTYRVGDINNDGKFTNFSARQKFDMFARDGFGLMSPTMGKDKDGGIVALGIVADKMATEWNLSKGYAHLYSLPRQLTLDSQNRLCQAPFAGYTAMRGTVSKVFENETLNGKMSLNPVRGRQAEVCATFVVGDASFGINFLTNSKGKGGLITYNPANHTVSMNVANVVTGDYGVKDASYQLPVYPAKGEECKLHLFIDHSICDLFVNDRYAASFRVFQEDMAYDLIELFSNGGATTVRRCEAYLVGEGDTSATPVEPFVYKLPETSGKVGFLYQDGGMSAQEQAAYSFYTTDMKLNKGIKTTELDKISTTNLDALWIHIDRKGIAQGANNLPAAFINADLLAKLREFSAAGGNIYLSGHATQMLSLLGRIPATLSPNVFSSGDGGNGNDQWTIRPQIGDGAASHTGHKIFANLEESDAFNWTTYGLLYGGGASILREDHNCMWEIQKFTYTSTQGSNVDKFQADTHSMLLGTWGQVADPSFAGLIEFYPLQNADNTYGGTIVANGLAACQWKVENGSNAFEGNLKLMTANTLAYLASKDGSQPENPGGSTVTPIQPEEPEIPGGPETLDSTGKVALYIGYNSLDELVANIQEKGAYDIFKAAYPDAEVIFANEVNKIQATEYDCIWIHAERENIGQGWQQLPDAFKNDSFVNALKAYVADGGNLYLSKQAAQLVNAIGRSDAQPTEFNSSSNTTQRPDDPNNDPWQGNVFANGKDWSEHPIFSGIDIQEVGHGKVFGLQAGGSKHYDRNVMWKLNDFGGHDNFCNTHNADVLATWGHNGGQAWGGIIEFKPNRSSQRAISAGAIEARKGTVIANGLAAYHLVPLDGTTNHYQANINALSANALAYLSPKAQSSVTTAVTTSELAGKVAVRGTEVVYAGFETEALLSVYTPDGMMVASVTVTGDGILALPVRGLVIVTVTTPYGTTAIKALAK